MATKTKVKARAKGATLAVPSFGGSSSGKSGQKKRKRRSSKKKATNKNKSAGNTSDNTGDTGGANNDAGPSPSKAPPRMKGEGLVFKYGACRPLVNARGVYEQFKRAHHYRNHLCEIERDRRDETDRALAELCPELVEVEGLIGTQGSPADPYLETEAVEPSGIEAEIQAYEREITRRRSHDRKRNTTPEEREHLKQLRARRSELRQRRRELRLALFGRKGTPDLDPSDPKYRAPIPKDPRWAERSQEIEDRAKARVKELRRSMGLYWGTYLQVENAAKSMRKGAPPAFRPWHKRKDKIAVQFQGGASIGDLLSGKDTRAQLTLSRRPRAIPGTNRGDNKLQGNLKIRVGSQGRDPIWAEVRLVYHRPIPTQAKIKWIYLTRRPLSYGSRWSVQFVLEADSWQKPDLATEGYVGIDVGWRLRPDGSLRVAVWAGSDGREGGLVLPAWWLKEHTKIKEQQAKRNNKLNEVRQIFLDLVEDLYQRSVRTLDLPGDTEDLLKDQDLITIRDLTRIQPIVLQEILGTDQYPEVRSAMTRRGLRIGKDARAWIRQSNSAPRFMDLSDCLLSSGVWLPQEIWDWRKKEKHWRDHERHLDDQLQGSRRDLYLRQVAFLTREYATLAIEDLDLSELHRRFDLLERDGDMSDDLIKTNFRIACLSSLFDAIKQRARHVDQIDPEFTTMCCHMCHEVDLTWTNHVRLYHRCPSCESRWDQDVNAARNLLRAALPAGAADPTFDREPVEFNDNDRITTPDGGERYAVMTYRNGDRPNKRQRRCARIRQRRRCLRPEEE